ncbi:MAG: FGGY-family carbohydrate kinase [Myxococcaceae bacterium]|nr:FGGY-family carbohydrate kinase [Myxococcaceae bacterium]
MAEERVVLTIDLGTSGPKAAVVNAAGEVLGSARGALRTLFGADGSAEQDPEQVWATTLASCREALATSRVQPRQVAAIVPSSQYSSVIPVDAQCRPVMNMITWMDQRGAPGRLEKEPGVRRPSDSLLALAQWLRIHGLAPIEGGISLTHMRWLRSCRPELYERTAWFFEPMDFLAFRFTGRATANPCSAYMWLLTDNRSLATTRWHPQLVAQSGISADKLPELVPVGSEVGPVTAEVAHALGLERSTMVLSGMPDTQAGVLAAGAFRGTHAAVSIGSTAVLSSHVPKKKLDPLASIWAMPSPTGDCFLMSAENGVAGSAVDHFVRNIVLSPEPTLSDASHPLMYDALNQYAAEAPAGAGGLLYLPWLRGSLAPAVDGRARGGFINLGLEHDRRSMARAVLEGIALNLKWLRGPSERFLKREISHFVLYGGGARSDLWCQILADVMGSPVHQMAAAGFANNVGTALFGFSKLGQLGIDDLPRRVAIKRVYEPDPAHRECYAELGERFIDAYKSNRPLFHKLHAARRLFQSGDSR